MNEPTKAGFQARLAAAIANHHAKRLKQIGEMLDAAGVPKWVDCPRDENVPSAAEHDRLRWFLMRRKDVKPSERRSEEMLTREMENLQKEIPKYL